MILISNSYFTIEILTVLSKNTSITFHLVDLDEKHNSNGRVKGDVYMHSELRARARRVFSHLEGRGDRFLNCELIPG